MAFYPEWVVVLDDAAKGSQPAELTPRIAQQIIDAIKELQRERDNLRAELDGTPRPPVATHDCDIPPGLTDSEIRHYECPTCGAHWVKVKRMVGRTMYRSWHRMSDEMVQRMVANRQNVRPA
jgi:hypothetical protein